MVMDAGALDPHRRRHVAKAEAVITAAPGHALGGVQNTRAPVGRAACDLGGRHRGLQIFLADIAASKFFLSIKR
jgi:hypothetical protein